MVFFSVSLFLFFFFLIFQATFFNFLPLSLSLLRFFLFLSTVATPYRKKTWGNIFLFNEIVEAFLNFSARCRHVRETKSNQSSRLCVCESVCVCEFVEPRLSPGLLSNIQRAHGAKRGAAASLVSSVQKGSPPTTLWAQSIAAAQRWQRRGQRR